MSEEPIEKGEQSVNEKGDEIKKHADLRAPIVAVSLDLAAFALYGIGVGFIDGVHGAAFVGMLCYLFAIILPVAAIIGGIVALCTTRPLKKLTAALCAVAILLPVILLVIAILLSNNGVGLIVLM